MLRRLAAPQRLRRLRAGVPARGRGLADAPRRRRSPYNTDPRALNRMHEDDDSGRAEDPFAEHPDNAKPFMGSRHVSQGAVIKVTAVAALLVLGYGMYTLVTPLLRALQRYDANLERRFGKLDPEGRRDPVWYTRAMEARQKREDAARAAAGSPKQ